MFGFMKFLAFGVMFWVLLRCCSSETHKSSRTVAVRIEVNNMHGEGFGFSITRLAEDEPLPLSERYRPYR